jgi:hypothetical protein
MPATAEKIYSRHGRLPGGPSGAQGAAHLAVKMPDHPAPILVLRRAQGHCPGDWNQDDFDVLDARGWHLQDQCRYRNLVVGHVVHADGPQELRPRAHARAGDGSVPLGV